MKKPVESDRSFAKWAKSATIGERIRWLIEARGYKQTELAAKMDLTQATISNWITGASRKPNAPSLLKLAAALQCNPQWVIDGTGDPWQMNKMTQES
jgi:transcriptional regulator with XRE-family HTH domain